MVGLELDDVINIANVHLVSFLGLFSLESMPEKYKEFVKKFKVGQNVNLPFLHWKLNLEDLSKFKLNEEILVRFNSYPVRVLSAFFGQLVNFTRP